MYKGMVKCNFETRWDYRDSDGVLNRIEVSIPDDQTLLQVEECIKHAVDLIESTYKNRLTRKLANESEGL